MPQADISSGGTSGAPVATPAAALARPTDARQSLEDRYGTGRRASFDRRFAWTAAALLVAAGIAFLVFSGWQQPNRVAFQDIGYTKNGDTSLDMKFQVTTEPNTPVACAVEALNTSKATVGWKIVELPVTDQQSHTVTARVVVTNPATAASVRDCWVIEESAAS
ncbi:DUF4307 domain-containing protein [Leucobacter manosquensis]|uniref:DUF4307 domain-containing protein n=1 Tax=Leucobacter manosquensis TaxID=2810611 RepID=UPI003211A897